MVSERHIASLAVGVIVVLTLALGPLGPLSVSPATSDELGSGSATLSVVSAPDSATLSAGRYTDIYYLDVPAAVVSVSEVRGSPLVTMSLSIEELGYSRSSVFVLSADMDGEHSFEITRDSLERDTVERDRYDGKLQLVVRDDSGKQVLVDRRVSVEVVE